MDNRGVLCVSLLLIISLSRDVAGDLTSSDFLRVYHRDGTTNDVLVSNASQLISLLDFKQSTMIFIPGYLETVDPATEDVLLITGAYLNYTSDNVLALDYRDVTKNLYTESVDYSGEVGKELATALQNLIGAGLSPDKLHLIGHSLGAQVAGATGRNMRSKISRITGLDPAGPLFYLLNTPLSKNDAQFVDIIHTDMGAYGLARQTGNVDFYPNFGIAPQPGCPIDIASFISACDHHASYKFYAASVAEPTIFPSIKCSNPVQFVTSQCERNDIVPMGYAVPRTATGKYYLQTSGTYPYGLGVQGTTFHLF